MRHTPTNRPGIREAERGFSLVELLIVVAIIVIIAAIALPSFIASRRAVRENLAITKLAEIGAAANAFRQNSTQRRYPFLGELNDKLPGQATPYCVITADASAVGLTTTTVTTPDAQYAQTQTLGPGGVPNTFNVRMIPLKDGSVDTTRPTYAVYDDGKVRSNGLPFPDYPGRTAPVVSR